MTQNQNEDMIRSKLEGIRKQAHKNVRLILKSLSFKGMDWGSRITGCCPVRHKNSTSPNDNDKAFSWDFDRQMWQCFSNRCHLINGADIFGLIRSVRGCSFEEAVNWVLKVINQDINDIPAVDQAELQKLNYIIKRRSRLIQHKKVQDEIMCHLQPSNYYKKRGFSDEVIQEFGCGGEWHKRGTYGEGRVVVPVYDPLEGFLIAFTCRILDDTQISTIIPKWSHCLNFAEIRKRSSDKTEEERFHVSSILFNLHRAKQYMGEPRTIIIVEGPGDVMRMWEAGMKNVVAALGTGFGKNHRTLLHKVGCQRVVVVPDNDAAGQKAAQSIEKLCKDYFEFRIVNITDKKDPGEMNPNQLRLLFKEYL